MKRQGQTDSGSNLDNSNYVEEEEEEEGEGEGEGDEDGDNAYLFMNQQYEEMARQPHFRGSVAKGRGCYPCVKNRQVATGADAEFMHSMNSSRDVCLLSVCVYKFLRAFTDTVNLR